MVVTGAKLEYFGSRGDDAHFRDLMQDLMHLLYRCSELELLELGTSRTNVVFLLGQD